MTMSHQVSGDGLEQHSPFVTGEILSARPPDAWEARTSLIAARSVFDRPWHTSRAAETGGPSIEAETFRLDQLPPPAKVAFSNKEFWLNVVRKAKDAGFRNPTRLADLAFFLNHPERMTGGAGKPITVSERDFHKLRAEWELYLTIVKRILDPSAKPTVFLPARASANYEDFVAAPTTGLITLMVNGRNASGSGSHVDDVSTYNRMQAAVETLGKGDSIFIANWQFVPTHLPLTKSSPGIANWGELLARKAKDGVNIRVIIAQHPLGSPFMSDLTPLDAIISTLPETNNFQYLVSAHPDAAGTHHQKFMVVKKGSRTVAFCGGLDISFNRTPAGWGSQFAWHDVGAQLEGLIARDLERQFVELWNRQRSKSSAQPLAGWKPFEKLALAPPSPGDRAPGVNRHRLQMLRTVSLGSEPSKIKRDDIWRGYFRLIGRATRFIYLENQYFHEPKLADAIAKQAEAQPGLIVIVVVGTGTDDRQSVDPAATGLDRIMQQAQVDATQNAFALRHEFFKRLFASVLPGSNRLRVYTLNYEAGITHSKLILVDDEALSVGSANANPRGFFFDTEVNVMLDDPAAVSDFRQRLWAHNLGVTPSKVASWSVSQFISQWDAVALSNNKALQKTPQRLVGEGVIPFKPLDPSDPRFRAGKRGPIRLGPLQNPSPPDVWF